MPDDEDSLRKLLHLGKHAKLECWKESKRNFLLYKITPDLHTARSRSFVSLDQTKNLMMPNRWCWFAATFSSAMFRLVGALLFFLLSLSLTSTKWKLSNFGLTSSLSACKQTETMNVYKTNNLSLISIDRRLFALFFFFCIRMECQFLCEWKINSKFGKKKNAMIRDSEWGANKRQAPWRRRHTFVMQFKNVLTIKITSIILLPKKKKAAEKKKINALNVVFTVALNATDLFPSK